MAGQRLDGWTGLFLTTTVLTSVTGFGFPFTGLLASHQVGIISLLVLPVVIFARYRKHLLGAWRGVYVVGTALVLYLNFFVLVVLTAMGVSTAVRGSRAGGPVRLPRSAFVLVTLFVIGATPAGLNGCGESGPSCLETGNDCGSFVSDKPCCDGLQC